MIVHTPPGEHTTRIDLRVSADLRNAMFLAAEARGVTVSQAIRESMLAYIANAIADAPGNNDGAPEAPSSLHDLHMPNTANPGGARARAQE